MSLPRHEDQYSYSSAYIQEDNYLIRMILLTHDPDPDGSQLDSMLLLSAVEKIIHYSSQNVTDPKILTSNISNVEAFEVQGTMGGTIYNVAHQIFGRCSGAEDLHTKTMRLFEMLGHFDWDEKLVLVLVALSIKYGEFQLISSLKSFNHIAASIAFLIQLPRDLSNVKKQFKAFSLLMNTMMQLIKLVVEFDNLPLQYELLESKEIAFAKSVIYIASYWSFRSSLAGFSLLTCSQARTHDQVDTSPEETWTLYSLVHKLSSLCSKLRKQVDACNEKIGARLYEKLRNDFSLSGLDNQEKLQILIPSNHRFPLKDCLSKEKHSIFQLKDKVVVLLLSKPELIPIDKIFFLVKQTLHHPFHEKLKENYVILWLPIVSSSTWTEADEKSFHLLSNVTPFWTVRQPWLIHSAIVEFIRQEWNFKEEEIMVVLDTQGKVTNLNAMHMVWTWGAKAFPFSRTKEKELWEMEHQNLQIIFQDVDLLLSSWLAESKSICIFASDSLDWIRNFTAKMKKIKETGLQLEVIYIGWKNPSERLKHILNVIETDSLSNCVSLRNICYFWLRLESIKKSILNLQNAAFCDGILKQTTGLLEIDSNEVGWMFIGNGTWPLTELIKLQGSKIEEFFNLFPMWAENVGKLGLVGAIRSSLEPRLDPAPTIHCCHSQVLPYKDNIVSNTVVCEQCKRPMEKFFVFKCEVTYY